MAVQYGMAIDSKRCMECGTCVVACRMENNCPADVRWCQVVNVGGDNPDSPEGTYPNLKMSAFTLACQHCADPACVAVCPTGASYKRERDGIVLVDAEKCIGCQVCDEACPYEGVRTLIDGEPVWYTDFPVGAPNAPEHLANTMGKCTFCVHRVDEGMKPFCVECCPARARHFGDLNDPESDVSKVLAKRHFYQLSTDAGTGPAVYILD